MSKVEELRNLKYKGIIKGYIEAMVSLGRFDDMSIEATAMNIYEHTLELMKARERVLKKPTPTKLTKKGKK